MDHLLRRLNRAKNVGAHCNHSCSNKSNDDGIFNDILSILVKL